MTVRILLIDNYDSFTYNLAQAFWNFAADVIVRRNDQITLEEAGALNASHLVISPGPGAPVDAGISMRIIEHFAGRLPILGVCLGHQAIGEVFGGRIVRADRLMHGKSSIIRHEATGLYAGLPSPMEVGRYHSLAIDESTLPDELFVTCRTLENEGSAIMGVRHRTLEIEGVQFHPESVLTPLGNDLLANFIKRAPGASAAASAQTASRSAEAPR